MDKKHFEGLLEGIRQAKKIMRGEMAPSRVFIFTPDDIKKIRLNLKLSQKEFSRMVFISVRTLQNWEQGRRLPQGPALALLMILKKDPKHALKALN